jgi:hypothetical protein
MKRILAVALLLLSFASVALADGGMIPPAADSTKQPNVGVVLLADRPFLPPTGLIPA